MFIKPFKVKSNNQLKGTERKKLCEEVAAAYPSLSDDQVQNLFPKKEAMSSMKIMTHGGQIGRVYCVAKIPMFFQLEQTSSNLLPTIFTLWHHPKLLYIFTTVEPVVPKLAGGAHLMLPGVVLEGPPTLWSFGKLAKGTPVSVDTEENKAAVAVGLTALSSEDMYMSGGHGKCVNIIHVIGDQLCQLGKHVPRPDLGPSCAELSEETSNSHDPSVEISQVSDTSISNIDDLVITSAMSHETSDPSSEANSMPIDTTETIVAPRDTVSEMDDLLEYCFLKACKCMKKTDLPVLSSNFFKNHLIAACPEGRSVDIKKSSYKKLSAFLSSMRSKGVVNTEILKGVESILSIKTEHPLLRDLVIMEKLTAAEPETSNAPVVAECYKVTADVLPILSKFRYEWVNNR